MFKSQLLGTKYVFKYQYLQMFGLKLNKYEYFSTNWSGGSQLPAQLQECENVKYLI